MLIIHPIHDFENDIYQKLIEAQVEASSNPKRLSHVEIFGPLRQKITNRIDSSKKLRIKYYHAN